MQRDDLVTVALIWPESATRYHARNPFAGSGVVEDPATGAAAAAFGGYLRERGFVSGAATVVIEQGVDMGRPSELIVQLVPGEAGVRVSGTAAPI
jgi:PhzF family phenazine biosynthesis protein